MSRAVVALVAPSPERSRAERVVRRLLLVPEGARSGCEASAQRLFSTSILLSATRCLLSYVLLPLVAPLASAVAGVEPYIGIPVAVLALGFDVAGMRRFWIADHRWRWAMTVLYLAVMALVTVLLVGDVRRLAG